MDIFLIFCNMKVCCVFSLESPHRGDSYECTQYTIFNMKMKIFLNYPKSAAKGFFQGTQELVRNSHGKRAISVRAIEVLLYAVILAQNDVISLLSYAKMACPASLYPEIPAVALILVNFSTPLYCQSLYVYSKLNLFCLNFTCRKK